MLDRAGEENDLSNELFRFSTTKFQWETLVSGSPPSAREYSAMVAVDSDLFVFGGGKFSGEEARCAC